jgi:hypothetical protein
MVYYRYMTERLGGNSGDVPETPSIPNQADPEDGTPVGDPTAANKEADPEGQVVPFEKLMAIRRLRQNQQSEIDPNNLPPAA